MTTRYSGDIKCAAKIAFRLSFVACSVIFLQDMRCTWHAQFCQACQPGVGRGHGSGAVRAIGEQGADMVGESRHA